MPPSKPQRGNSMDQILNAIEKVPEAARYLIVLGISILAIALYVFLLRFPTQDKLDALIDQLDQRRAVLSEKKKIADELQSWQIEVQKLEVQLKEALQQLPSEVDTDQLLITIPNIAKKNALLVDQFELKNEVRAEGYAEIPMKLKMRGTYRGIGSFAQEVGDQPRIMAVTDLKMVRASRKKQTASKNQPGEENATEEEAGVELEIEANVVTYRFLDTPPAAKNPAQNPKGKP